MPDGKITRQRLRDHLRRLWYVYLAGAVALIFLNNLAYTVTRPGWSDAETLKIMLLNADVSVPEDALLQAVQPLGFKAVETAPLAVTPGDPTGEMLLMVQITGGFGDIYIADAHGLDLLRARGVCLPLEDGDSLPLGNGMRAVVASNGTDIQSALEALPFVIQEIME